MSKRRVMLPVSYEALGRLLHLRAGIAVVGVDVDPKTETVDFVLSSEEFVPIPRRETIPRVPASAVMDWELEQ